MDLDAERTTDGCERCAYDRARSLAIAEVAGVLTQSQKPQQVGRILSQKPARGTMTSDAERIPMAVEDAHIIQLALWQ